MSSVDVSLIEKLVTPLTGLADDDEAVARFRAFDATEPSQIRAFAIEILLPDFDRLSPEKKDQIKAALDRALSIDGFPFDRILYSNLVPFNVPKEAKLFFTGVRACL